MNSMATHFPRHKIAQDLQHQNLIFDGGIVNCALSTSRRLGTWEGRRSADGRSWIHSMLLILMGIVPICSSISHSILIYLGTILFKTHEFGPHLEDGRTEALPFKAHATALSKGDPCPEARKVPQKTRKDCLRMKLRFQVQL